MLSCPEQVAGIDDLSGLEPPLLDGNLMEWEFGHLVTR